MSGDTGAGEAGRETAKVESEAGASAEQRTEHLQAEVEAARDDLGDLIGELDRRRHRAMKPLVVSAIAVAVVGVGGYIWWRLRRSRPAARRELFARRPREEGASAAKKIFTAAAAAAASVAGRRVAERWAPRAVVTP